MNKNICKSEYSCRVRHQHGHQIQVQAQVQAQQQTGNTLDLAKYRRSASSMLWIYGLFILCYLPNFCMYFVLVLHGHNAFIHCIYEFTWTLVLLNSSLNPLIYCFRLPEIRAEVLRTIRKMFDQSSEQWDQVLKSLLTGDDAWPELQNMKPIHIIVPDMLTWWHYFNLIEN